MSAFRIIKKLAADAQTSKTEFQLSIGLITQEVVSGSVIDAMNDNFVVLNSETSHGGHIIAQSTVYIPYDKIVWVRPKWQA